VRKFQCRKALELLYVIGKAQDSGLYSDCQAGVLGLCDFIEYILGETAETTLNLLEGYCELLYKVHKGEVSKNALRKYFIKLEKHFKHGLKPTKLEVVFISHKVSMADSLESVYFAAKKDPSCDVYWIPVPYYELDANAKSTIMCYEGDQYSSDYQITDWQEYDIKVRRPDIVFYNNPYDKYNRVSIIHPDFHAESIKDYAEYLVYIPYYVWTTDDWNDPTIFPGTLYADMVVAESEKKQQTYVRHLKEWVKKSGVTATHPSWKYVAKPEEKFVPLESPKYDKVINTSRDSYILPTKWQNMVDGIDNTRKKVIVYSTRFTELADPIEQRLNKIKQVFDFFKRKCDVLLWYRPHPLNMQCLTAMEPNYLAQYKQMIDEFKREAWGIYDDTGNFHRAVAMCDAYYGEWSSTIAIYAAAGKPVMLGNPSLDVSSNNDEYLLGDADDIRCLYTYCFNEVSSTDLNSYVTLITDTTREGDLSARGKKVISLLDICAEGTAGQAIYERSKAAFFAIPL